MSVISGKGALDLGQMQVQKSNQDGLLKSVRGTQDRQKAKELARDFEAIFTGIMLKSMRDSVQKSGLIDGGNAEDIYRSMLDAEYSKMMATQGTGLADTIERYLLDAIGLKATPGSPPGVTRDAALKAYVDAASKAGDNGN